MTESSDKLRAFSRRQPVNSRQRSRKVQKEPKKVRVPQPHPVVRDAMLTSGAIAVNGMAKPKPKLVMPTAVKPIPKKPVNTPSYPHIVKTKTVRTHKPIPPKITKRVSKKTRLKPMARNILYILRLLIVGIGVGAIVGTALSILDPATRINSNSAASSNNSGQVQPTTNPAVATGSLYLTQEITPLKNAVQNLTATAPDLTPGVFLVDLDNGGYVDINAAASFPAASTIKVPLLIAFFQDVDAGKIRLDEMLTMQQDMVAGGSGNFQFKPIGTQYTALEVATKMITISDNTATNMVIARLGGIEAVNQRFRTLGLTTTVINNKLPDLQGTNTTSPKELGNLLAMVNQGNLVSVRSRDTILDIMRRTERDHLLPSGLGTGAKIYHKTGDIGTMLADAGLVDVPNGKRYIIATMVKRPNNDPRAEKLISSISRTTYETLSQSTAPRTINNIPTASYPSPASGIIPPSGYQSPAINPPVTNNIPTSSYQSPVVNPQYYPPR